MYKLLLQFITGKTDVYKSFFFILIPIYVVSTLLIFQLKPPVIAGMGIFLILNTFTTIGTWLSAYATAISSDEKWFNRIFAGIVCVSIAGIIGLASYDLKMLFGD